jgi:N-sulfoglucosamine sulfohydrolase
MPESRDWNRRQLLKACAAGAGWLTLDRRLPAALHVAPPQSPPNILWIIAEDLSPELGCYGNPDVRTPNIDKFASEGMRYTGAFATAPVCSACRSSLMTGMYQTSIGAHNHRTAPKGPLDPTARLVTDRFREAGYFTSNAAGDDWAQAGKTDLNFTLDRPFDGTDWRQRRPGQPFFAQVNFNETHRAFSRDPERSIAPDSVELPPYYPDHPIARRDWADYLECAQVLDRKVGALLRRLEEDGLAENTVVFFFGDHGRAHVRDKQFLYDGGIRIPLVVRWPGRMEAGAVSDSLVSTVDLAAASLAAAGIPALSGPHGRPFLETDTPERDVVFAARDRCDETYDRIRCVRDHEFKYIRNYFPNLPYMQGNLYKLREYPVWSLLQWLYAQGRLTPAQERFMATARPAEELYDLRADPHEVENLADSVEYRSVLESMRRRLDDWVETTGDRGEVPEDPRVAARVYLDRHQPYHQQVMRERGLPPHPNPREFLRWWAQELGVDVVI